MDVLTAAGIRFGRFLLDRCAGGLFRLDEHGSLVPVPLGSRALDVLCVLVERAGELVSKQTIMDAVWPDTAVEENNLTVQVSALRRVLDQGRPEGSCIQTVAGRGYRFVVPVVQDDQAHPASNGGVERTEDDVTAAGQAAPSLQTAPRRRGRFRAVALAGLGLVVVVLLLIFARGHEVWRTGSADRPRLSLVVLPFQNMSGDPKDDYLADGVTDDLTSDLSHLPGALVIARQSAYTYQGKPADVRKVGEELGVRYVLEGSVRRIGSVLRVNAQLVSAETGIHLWSDRFDQPITELAAGQEQIVSRMRSELGISLVDIEQARSRRERPTSPDAFDLVLRARSILYQLPNKERQAEALALLEQALSRDPQSAYALATTAFLLMERNGYPGWASADDMERAETRLARARSIAPGAEVVLGYTVPWLRKMERFQEAKAVAEELVQRYPNNFVGYLFLANSRTTSGLAEESIPLSQKAIRLDPRSPWLFNRYRDMGFASLMLGRDTDAITFLERSLATHPEFYGRQWIDRFLAAAYARTGRLAEARHALNEADRLFPYDTVRSHWPDDPSGTVYADQIRRLQDALRLAGERDHAEEDADFGVVADAALHGEFAGRTPTTAPGAKTVRTGELARFLAESRPVVIDTVSYSWGRSIPGAIGLRFAGVGGSSADAAQDRLRSKVRELSGRDLNRPVVAVGWNSERFDGRNLALRLVALGYTRVYWYRGGREAWEVNGLPEAELNIEEW